MYRIGPIMNNIDCCGIHKQAFLKLMHWIDFRKLIICVSDICSLSRPQRIKEKIAQTLKALQKRYVTTDAPVTSEDSEANQLCCALEAVFIHGLRSKHIRADGAGARGRKGPSLPQPVFWSLLKSVTHRQVHLLPINPVHPIHSA